MATQDAGQLAVSSKLAVMITEQCSKLSPPVLEIKVLHVTENPRALGVLASLALPHLLGVGLTPGLCRGRGVEHCLGAMGCRFSKSADPSGLLASPNQALRGSAPTVRLPCAPTARRWTGARGEAPGCARVQVPAQGAASPRRSEQRGRGPQLPLSPPAKAGMGRIPKKRLAISSLPRGSLIWSRPARQHTDVHAPANPATCRGPTPRPGGHWAVRRTHPFLTSAGDGEGRGLGPSQAQCRPFTLHPALDYTSTEDTRSPNLFTKY